MLRPVVASLMLLVLAVTGVSIAALQEEGAQAIDPAPPVPREDVFFTGEVLAPSGNVIEFSVLFMPRGETEWDGALTIGAQGIIDEPVHVETFDQQILQFRWEPNSLHESQFPVWLVRFTEVDASGLPSKAEGKFVQSGNVIDLTMQRRNAPVGGQRLRPQHPVAPYPYQVEDVVFESEETGVFLSGTLTIPEGEGPFPAMFLVSGSGPQDRDSLIFGHRPFLVWADEWTRRGIAVLRYDDRGHGRSQGDLRTATTFSFARDAVGAHRFLAQRPEVDASRIGVFGHSEGAIVAAFLQGRVESACYVLACGPAVSGLDVSALQATDIHRRNNMPDEIVDDFDQKNRAALRAARDSAPREELVQYMIDALDVVMSPDLPERETALQDAAQLHANQLAIPWVRTWLNLDPTTAYTRLDAPTLAIFGELDTQVPPEHNLVAMRTALRDAPADDTTVEVFPQLNHLLQPAESGKVDEYLDIETTIDPDAIEFVSAWIAQRLAATPE
ncbi:MAG: alpha/beta fold hydrolase [Planctomycetota bacterium]